jgi:putative intracellular protease/amidase
MKRSLLILAICLLCAGPAYPETVESAAAPSVEARTPRTNCVLMIISQYNFPDDEYTIPKVIMSRGGYTVEVASQSTREVALGTDIIKVRPNLTIEQIDVDRYDAVIMVGGYLSKKFYENPVLIEKVKEFNAKGKLIGAMDNMPYFLAQWGIVGDRKVTVNKGLVKPLKSMHVNYVEKNIVVDKDLITVDNFLFSDAFAIEFLQELNNRNK